MTVLTDSAEMYQSRLQEMTEVRGHEYSQLDAAIDYNRYVQGVRTDSMEELTYQSR